MSSRSSSSGRSKCRPHPRVRWLQRAARCHAANWRLTLPSRGRLTAGSAVCKPPLMSNVRPRVTKFFPPSQLPPMREMPAELEEMPTPVPRARRAFRFVLCTTAGAVVAVCGFWWSSSPVWFAAVPVLAALGWAFATEPQERPPAQESRRSGGPVLW